MLLVVGAVSSLTTSIVGVIDLCSFYSIDYLQRVSFPIKNKSYTAKCFNLHSKFNNENEKKKYNAWCKFNLLQNNLHRGKKNSDF